MNPQKRSGNPGSFSSTNMGIIGFATNGVPIFNPYDSSCCDAGLYELTALDMCYAHPNGTRNQFLAIFWVAKDQLWVKYGLKTGERGQYHYHVGSECLAACNGASEIIGVALDGFPIYGPGLNPANGQVWSQDDMDDCGGRDDANGNYGYYVTGKG